MKKEEIMKNVSTTFSKVSVKLKKHSPEILIVAGVVGTVASAVMACHATTKLDSVLEKSKKDIDVIHKCAENEELATEYSKDDAKKDLAIVYVQAGVKVAKLYAPAVALGTLSIASIVASHNILKKRNVALAAAYATVDKTFKEYRNRVVERFGAEVDKELRYNIKAKKFEETVTDPDSGKEKKVKSTVDVAAPSTNDYARFFDESCEAYESNMDYNLMYLRSQQNLANDKEAHGQQHSIREKRPRKSVGFPKRSKQHSRNDLRNDHPQKDSHRHREYEQEKSLSKKEQAYGFLLHSQGCLNGKLLLLFSQHETIDIVDQKQQKQTNPANCQFHTSSQQGNIIFRTNGRMIMGAADRQKRIEQGDTECHGHNINQIVLHRPLCIFENKFSVHRSCPLPSW